MSYLPVYKEVGYTTIKVEYSSGHPNIMIATRIVKDPPVAVEIQIANMARINTDVEGMERLIELMQHALKELKACKQTQDIVSVSYTHLTLPPTPYV